MYRDALVIDRENLCRHERRERAIFYRSNWVKHREHFHIAIKERQIIKDVDEYKIMKFCSLQ
jgi:hypothetical protein